MRPLIPGAGIQPNGTQRSLVILQRFRHCDTCPAVGDADVIRRFLNLQVGRRNCRLFGKAITADQSWPRDWTGIRSLPVDEGFNAATEKYENLVEAGVIDPTKVVRIALQNAASISGLMLTTEALIADMPEEDKGPKYPAAPGGDMY